MSGFVRVGDGGISGGASLRWVFLCFVSNLFGMRTEVDAWLRYVVSILLHSAHRDRRRNARLSPACQTIKLNGRYRA